MRLLLEHSLPFNLEYSFYETSKRRTLYKSYFKFGVVTLTRSIINTPVLLTTRKALSTPENPLAEDPNTRAREIEPFRKLLCSMYTRPYVIKDVIELLTITDLADYYCCDYPKKHLCEIC